MGETDKQIVRDVLMDSGAQDLNSLLEAFQNKNLQDQGLKSKLDKLSPHKKETKLEQDKKKDDCLIM